MGANGELLVTPLQEASEMQAAPRLFGRPWRTKHVGGVRLNVHPLHTIRADADIGPGGRARRAIIVGASISVRWYSW